MTVVVPPTPPLTPVTTPVADILPFPGKLLLHTPPPGVEFKEVVKPTQTANDGLAVIAVGLGLIVTVVVVKQPVVVSE